MIRWTTRRVGMTIAAVVVCSGLTGCSSGSGSDAESAPSGSPSSAAPVSYVAENLTCDFDRASTAAQTANERIGGRVEKDFRVRFSQTTDVGIVALVTGDPKKAFDLLHERFGVAIVATVERDKDVGRINSFAQVAKLVESVCG